MKDCSNRPLFWPGGHYPCMNVRHTGRRIAFIIGTGNSINKLKREDWNVIHEHADTWSLNMINFHPFVSPHYIHLEQGQTQMGCYNGRDSPPYSYENNTVLCQQECNLLKEIKWTRPLQTRIYGNYDFSASCPNPRAAVYTPTGTAVRVPCGCSLNRVLDLARRFMYDEVYFYGFDFGGGYYWEDKQAYDGWYNKIRCDRGTWGMSNHKVGEKSHQAQSNGIHDFIPYFGAYNGFKTGAVINDDGSPGRKLDIQTITMSRFVKKLQSGCTL